MTVEDRVDSRWEVLAIARFLLAMIVMTAHMAIEGQVWTSWTSFAVGLDPLSAVFGFLLISGYSIAASLDREEPGYFWRRIRRIYPTYLTAVALGAITILLGAGAPAPAWQFLMMAAMLQSFVAAPIHVVGHLWTLGVEWWNYMAAPAYRRARDGFLIGALLASLCLFVLLKIRPGVAQMSAGIPFITMSWMWIAGFLYYRRPRTLYGYAILLVPLALAARFWWMGSAVWIGAIALAVCDGSRVPQQAKAPLRWLGELSYPIYAVHIPMIFIFLHWGVKWPAVIVLSVLAVSVLVLHTVDLPLRRMRLPRLPARPLKKSVTVEP